MIFHQSITCTNVFHESLASLSIAKSTGLCSRSQREALIAPVRERWNNTPPERRQNLYDRARSWQRMSPEQHDQARRGMHRFENMSPQQQREARALFAKMRNMDKAQREQLREQWQKMTPEQRRQWVEANPPR